MGFPGDARLSHKFGIRHWSALAFNCGSYFGCNPIMIILFIPNYTSNGVLITFCELKRDRFCIRFDSDMNKFSRDHFINNSLLGCQLEFCNYAGFAKVENDGFENNRPRRTF